MATVKAGAGKGAGKGKGKKAEAGAEAAKAGKKAGKKAAKKTVVKAWAPWKVRLAVTLEKCPQVVHALVQVRPSGPKRPGAARGMVVLAPGLGDGWSLQLVNAAGVKHPVPWALPSPKLAEKFPASPGAATARFLLREAAIDKEGETTLQLVSPKGESLVIARTGKVKRARATAGTAAG